MNPLDEIAITGIRAFGRHGVFAHERAEGQEFVVDAALYIDGAVVQRAAVTDDVTDTVHYGEVAVRIAEIIGGDPVNLIETLAERIATAVLEGWPVHMVRITVHKPQAPIPVPFDDVTVSVTRVRIEGAL
ncbi:MULTISPECIES: dihydroneopterin aldolase [Microbacterium]|jgi:7,8-dihydroneopterin aldolase/epimerase/oxygenase|uniref:dihydroneopterin aldolase n=1 Tax=Microbacterium TaxID=33882 RepID=UPI0010F4A49D|nr:dihydroneopterin aldolase [Microbacterium sp. 4NA327F11]MCK9916460.1 dihydroneopterin aldolase [Microbacteriaceae bacterium K1510]